MALSSQKQMIQLMVKSVRPVIKYYWQYRKPYMGRAAPGARFIPYKSLACVQPWEHIPQSLKSMAPLVCNTMVEETYTTTKNRDTIIQMFLDETAGEVYHKGRLATVPTENGVQLVAYGNEVLAQIESKEVTLYTGHHSTVSNTVTRYIKRLGSELANTEGREVTVASHESPTLGIGARASDSAQYINEYFDVLKGSFSAVERNAVDEVNRALNRRMSEIFD